MFDYVDWIQLAQEYILKEMEGSSSGEILVLHWEELRKISKNLRQDSSYPGRDVNPYLQDMNQNC